jgi:hypothetical protein
LPGNHMLIIRAHDLPWPADFHVTPRKVCCYHRKMPRRGNVKCCNVFRDFMWFTWYYMSRNTFLCRFQVWVLAGSFMIFFARKQ